MRKTLLTLGFATALGAGCGDPPPEEAKTPEEVLAEQEYEEDRIVGVSGDPDAAPDVAAAPAGVCAGDLAADTFGYGLCVCGDLGLNGQLETEALSGAVTGAPLGVNGDYLSIGDSHVRGDSVVAGAFTPLGNHDVEGALMAGAGTTMAGDLHVLGDAHVGADVTGYWYRIDGDLVVPADASLPLAIDLAGDTVLDDVQVAAPCDCDAARQDIDTFVAQAQATNDNEAIGLAADSWIAPGGRLELALPPGRYYVDAVETVWPVEITISGPTALYVGGDVTSASVFEVKLDGDDAELDLFIAGDIVATGVFELGSRERFKDVRVYVGGDGDITLLGDSALGGMIAAPDAEVYVAGPIDIHGALLVGGLHDDGRVRVFYDDGVQQEGETCPTTDDADPDDTDPDDDLPPEATAG